MGLTLALSGCDRPELASSAQDVPAPPDASSDTGTPSPPTNGGECGDYNWPKGQTLETDERVEVILQSLNLTEKIEQMAGQPGGADLFSTPDNSNANIRGFKFRDGPRGVKLENGNATCFPVAVARAATFDLDLEERIGTAMGAEVKGSGHNLLLAPCVNTLRHPGWGRGQETYGEDPWYLGMMGIAFTVGTQKVVPACVKHFAGNNIEDTRHTNNAVMDEQTLRENYARQFKMVVERSDAACVMSAYNKVNDQYCSENGHLLREILKDEWSFDGIVISDWWAAKSTIESALGGLDVEMPFREYYDKLELAVSSGQVPTDVIDDAVRRILRIKFRFGMALLDEPFDGDPEDLESWEHIQLARETAEKAAVLLKNDSSALPIDASSVSTISVLGRWANQPRLGDKGSSDVYPSYAVTPLFGLVQRAGSDATVSFNNADPMDASAAAGADVAVVVVALSQTDEGEAWNGGGDRDELTLSADQETLIKEVAAVNDRTIVVIEAGGPVTMASWADDVEAIVMAWYPGMEGGTAIANLLFGDKNFAGRLPQTWPHKLEDEPVFGNKQDETEFNFYHGYRHFDHNGIEPLFPFGFGLSYTSFAYSNLQIPCDTVTPGGRLVVTVDVENTGDREGVAVPQLFVSFPNTAVRRPPMEFKGFTRVELGPGEKKTVEIPVRVEDLAYWDTGANGWAIEKVAYTVHVGDHQRDLPLTGSFTIGDTAVSN